MIKQYVPDAFEASNNAGSVIYTILPEKISELEPHEYDKTKNCSSSSRS